MVGGFVPRLGRMNPLRLLPINTRFDYEKLPLAGSESATGSPFNQVSFKKYRWRSPSPGGSRFPPLVKMSLSRLLTLVVTALICLGLIVVGGIRGHKKIVELTGPADPIWWKFERLNGYYNGVGSIVSRDKWIPEQEFLRLNMTQSNAPHKPTTNPPLDPIPFNPYDKTTTDKIKDQSAIVECYLDANETIRLPNVYAYPGVPQNYTANFMGSYDVLGLRDDVCWERFGRFGPYGYGYEKEEGGVGLAQKSEKAGSSKIWSNQAKVDYRGINWGDLQQRCYQKNAHRFKAAKTTEPESTATASSKTASKTASSKKGAKAQETGLKKKGRQAYILRAYTGYKYDDHQLLTLRAMITELSLKSGGEYDVHLLVQVRDDSIPIWTDKEVYRKTLESSVPKEFWGITTLWTEALMRLYYPAPFPGNFENPSGQSIHGVYRGAHFPLFWFAQQHPEYEFYWNWEMDLRYTGHYYEFNKQITEWAKEQPRKGMWERSAQYFIPSYHGTWSNFTQQVEAQTLQGSESPIWGPATFQNDGLSPPPNETIPSTTWFDDDYNWGVGEEADYISFNPLFDPSKTTWVFRDDVDGFSKQYPIPPRRVAIITVARLSKRLLDIAHVETYKHRHTMFPEMWPPTIALHHGLKAVYAPHPVYFDRQWPLNVLDQVFNHPKKPVESVFGGGEHNQAGSSFYYNSGFAGALWRRWFGYRENSEGGSWTELTTTGRLCLKSTLFHPIKFERAPTE